MRFANFTTMKNQVCFKELLHSLLAMKTNRISNRIG